MQTTAYGWYADIMPPDTDPIGTNGSGRTPSINAARIFALAFAGAFAGKVAAAIFLAACIALGFGPSEWITVIVGPDVYPWVVRAVFFGLGALVLFLEWRKSSSNERNMLGAGIILGLVVAAISLHFVGPKIWKFSEPQKRDLRIALTASPIRIPVAITVVPGAPSDAVDAAYEVMYAFQDAHDWPVGLAISGDAFFSPHNVGLLLAFPNGTDLGKDEKVNALKSAFTKGGFDNIVLSFSPHAPNDGVEIVLGRNP